jgi:hypothetical protein
MLILKGYAGLDRIFRTQARCADEDVRTSLQKGGFVYLTYSYPTAIDSQFVVPLANIADHTDANYLKHKLIYPVLIERPEPGTPRTDFKPINEAGLITILVGGFECFVNTYSYISDLTVGGQTHAAIVAGSPLKIYKHTQANLRSDAGLTAANGDRAMLVMGTGTWETTVAYALSGVLTNGEIRIKWIG